MLYANNSNGERIAVDDCSPDETYFCPVCGQRLKIKATNSICMRRHFAHISKCTDSWKYEEMSEWHLNWQSQFPEECREVVVSHNSETHRADVLINNTVIEFQHSRIHPRDIEQRNTFYGQLGYQVVWVFDGVTEDGCYKIKENTLDGGWCWVRKKELFTNGIPPFVDMMIHFKTADCFEEDFLFRVKGIEFHKDIFPETGIPWIRIKNFLKEYGAISKTSVDNISTLQAIVAVQDLLPLLRSRNSLPIYRRFLRPKRHIRF